MTHSLYPDVYDAIRVGPVDIKNRLFQAPHGSIAQLSPPAYGLASHV